MVLTKPAKNDTVKPNSKKEIKKTGHGNLGRQQDGRGNLKQLPPIPKSLKMPHGRECDVSISISMIFEFIRRKYGYAGDLGDFLRESVDFVCKAKKIQLKIGMEDEF